MVMANWLSILQEFQVDDPAPTRPKGPIPTLEPKPKAILFDIYGTLVCPQAGNLDDQVRLASGKESFIATAKRFGFSKEKGIQWHEWFFETIRAEHREEAKKGIAPAEVQVDRIWTEMLTKVGGDLTVSPPRMVAAYRELMANPIRPFSGVVEALLKLKKSGIMLGLASNSQFYTLPIVGKVLGIKPEEFFEAKLTFLSFHLGFSKPSPYFFRLVRTRALNLGFRPEEVLAVGNDCENDILPAKVHGFQTLLFWGNAQSVRKGGIARTGPMVTNFEALLKACGM
jgi:putative hydrolase of the HAD superfamily